MTSRFRRTLAATSVSAVALLACAGPANAVAAPATTQDPAVGAAGWLAQQFVDGDHFNFPGSTYYWGGLTASGLFGLAAAKVGQDRIDAVLAYMADNVAYDANIGFGDQPGPYDGSVATTALAAIVGGADATDFGGVNLLQTLKDDECTAVSGPVDENDWTTPLCVEVGAARNIYSSVSESLTILAESRGAAGYGNQYAPSSAAVDYFLSLQCPGGGFTSLTDPCTDDTAASVDETAYGAAALAALGGHATELTAALDWLTAQRSADGYWVAEGGPNVNSTGLAVSALDGAGRDVAASRTWLATQQVIDGPTVGEGASRGALLYQGEFDADASIKATADGLLGLAPGGSLATLTSEGATAAAPVLELDAAELSDETVTAGHSLTVTAYGFAADEKVTVVIHSSPVTVGTATADADGTATLTFTVPTTIPAGDHSIVLTGATSGLSTLAPLSVTAAAVIPRTSGSHNPSATPTAATPTTAGTNGVGTNEAATAAAAELPATGSHTGTTLALALTCLALGSGAVFTSRRRQV